MPVFLAELPYFLWRPLALLAQVPLFAVFRVLDFITTGVGRVYPQTGMEVEILWFPLWGILYTTIFASAFAFGLSTLFELGLRAYRVYQQKTAPKKRAPSLLRRHWVFLWLVLWFVVIGVGRLMSDLQTSLYLDEWFVSLYLGGFVFGVVAMMRYGILGLLQMSSLWKRKGKARSVWLERAGRVLLVCIAVYPFLAFLGIFAWLRYETNPAGSQFHVLHAAVKNTCLIDPERENCPHTLEELSYIEPEAFARAEAFTQMQYQYDLESNQYSLVIRYTPERAVVFDQRLHDEYGLDFHEYSVQLLGQDRLKNAPDWNGLWTFSDWEY